MLAVFSSIIIFCSVSPYHYLAVSSYRRLSVPYWRNTCQCLLVTISGCETEFDSNLTSQVTNDEVQVMKITCTEDPTFAPGENIFLLNSLVSPRYMWHSAQIFFYGATYSTIFLKHAPPPNKGRKCISILKTIPFSHWESDWGEQRGERWGPNRDWDNYSVYSSGGFCCVGCVGVRLGHVDMCKYF